MEPDYRMTVFTVKESNIADRLYAITMTNGDRIITENDDTLECNIVELYQGFMGYFEDHGATGDELAALIMSNVRLCIDLEKMMAQDPTLKELVEVGGLSSKAYYPNGIN